MTQATKIKFASLITALFVGGLAALGLATSPGANDTVAVAPAEGPVVHKRKVKTVRVPSAPAATPAVASVPVSSPAPVSSSVSPGAGAGGYEDDDDGEEDDGGEERD